MARELERRGRGEVKAIQRDEDVAKAEIVSEAKQAAWRIQGVERVGEETMLNASRLVDLKRSLAGDDPELMMLLDDIQGNTVRGMKKAQLGLFDAFGL